VEPEGEQAGHREPDEQLPGRVQRSAGLTGHADDLPLTMISFRVQFFYIRVCFFFFEHYLFLNHFFFFIRILSWR
jgi:hypothetical protein